ncbi:hypothetical protein K4H33_01040 [Clostridium chauvoei]|uniref:hypothetical protein n=1 Tax=Clostridium chauvoei TaxID=46867 RepID=UPI001C8437C9|nr:hypothetical protein [Clostridium chauvoei]MBX7352610.1 hypothetical protein [Clostridium chauvoei]
MKNIVEIQGRECIYKGNTLKSKDELELIKILNKNLEIIIIGEPLLIKIYDFNKDDKNLEEFIEENLEKEFLVNSDMLFHYEYFKKNNLVYIYSIKRGLTVEKLSKDAKKLKVIPIQFLIKDLINRKFKKYKDIISITKFRDIYYLTSIKNKMIVDCDILDINKDINDILVSYGSNNLIVLDDDIKEKIDTSKFKLINFLKIGEIIDERIYKKQRLYTKEFFKKERRKVN